MGKCNSNTGTSALPDYQSCLRECISLAVESGDELSAARYAGYPVPSLEEWAACLEVVIAQGESLENPIRCMRKYELRLARKGIRTAAADRLDALAFDIAGPDVPLKEAHAILYFCLLMQQDVEQISGCQRLVH